jgi:hypothetical protein
MKIEERQKFLVILTFIVVGLYVGDLVIYEPLTKWFSARSQLIAQLRKQVKDGKFMIQREAGIRSEWSEMQTNTLPADTSQAEQQMLRAFDNWSRASGADVSDILPEWKSDEADYMTLNCRVEASGSLDTLSRFLYEIERDPMSARLDSVELAARDATGQELTLGLEISGLALTPNNHP